MTLRFSSLILLAVWLSACGDAAPPSDPAASAVNGDASAPATTATAEPARVEPTEDEMETLEKISLDAVNANGGIVIEMSGVKSPPIRMKLESFRKIGCKPYTRAFRCESEIGLSYPGSDFPNETLPASHRYQKDEQGRWTRD